MKKVVLILVSVAVLVGCQKGSETVLRERSLRKQVDSHLDRASTSSLEMAPRGWYNGAFDDPLMTWDEANRLLLDIEIRGEKGWRLPTGEELLVLCGNFEEPLCFAFDFELPVLNYAMNDSELPLEMFRYGRNAEQKKHWWWLSASMENASKAVVMAPNFVRSFASKNERFSIRPVRGSLSKDERPNIMWTSDRENVASGGCYSESREQVNVAWMKSCSSMLLCEELQVRGCVLGISSIETDTERTVVAVLNDSTLDTYEYGRTGRWGLLKQQPLPDLLRMNRTEPLLASVTLTDFTGDGLHDLEIRIGPPDFGTASWNLGLALFTWDSATQLWERVVVPFADGQDYREDGLLRSGYVDGSNLYEDVSYSGDYVYVDDVFFHFIWDNGRFKYLGVVEKPESD